MAIRKLILGSNEAMQHEPSLVEPRPKPTPRDQWQREIKEAEEAEQEDLFPKGIDDSMGG